MFIYESKNEHMHTNKYRTEKKNCFCASPEKEVRYLFYSPKFTNLSSQEDLELRVSLVEILCEWLLLLPAIL